MTYTQNNKSQERKDAEIRNSVLISGRVKPKVQSLSPREYIPKTLKDFW